MPNDTASSSIVVFERVEKTYPPDAAPALKNATFAVARGEFVCIVGPSGSGKSTILKIIAGLEREDAGRVIKPANVGMAFQSGALFPWLSVFENVAIVLQMKKMPEHDVRRQSVKYLELMGLGPYLARYPRELSGGQRQRVGIARALTVDPEVLLLDEPFSSLDAKTTDELHNDLVRIWQETKKTVIMVSHLIEEAVSLAQRVILVKNFTVTREFPIALARPRREQGAPFVHAVLEIRREFFK